MWVISCDLGLISVWKTMLNHEKCSLLLPKRKKLLLQANNNSSKLQKVNWKYHPSPANPSTPFQLHSNIYASKEFKTVSKSPSVTSKTKQTPLKPTLSTRTIVLVSTMMMKSQVALKGNGNLSWKYWMLYIA